MRVAIVSRVVVERDVLSAAIVGQAKIAQGIPGVESVTIFAQHIDRALPCAGYIVGDPWTLARSPEFTAADLVILHWGVDYQLFDVITLCADRAVVDFHNCTPSEFVEADGKEGLIGPSSAQTQHAIALGVRLWTASEFNEQTLREWGAAPEQIDFVPFPIDLPHFAPIPRTSRHVELLNVGRQVPIEGQHVLLEAIGLLSKSVRHDMHLRMAASRAVSDRAYHDRLLSLITRHELQAVVEFVESPTDDELRDLYRTSDVVVSSSFHEGLGVPNIKGYSYGCRAIGTTAGNLPYVVQPPDPCVPPGEALALASALKQMIAEVSTTETRQRLHSQFIDRYSENSSKNILQIQLYRYAASRAAQR